MAVKIKNVKIEIEPTNIKPDPFYKAFSQDGLEEFIRYEKEQDKLADNIELAKHLNENYFLEEEEAEAVGNIFKYRKDTWDFCINNNTIEKNKEKITEFLEEVKKYKSISQLKGFTKPLLRQLNLLQDKLSEGDTYLYTSQLNSIRLMIEDMKRDINIFKERKELFVSVDDLNFKDFEIDKEGILSQIQKEANWHKPNRDLEIYNLKKDQGLNLKEIGKRYGIKFNSVSMIVKKVQGKINEVKGNKFEKFVYNRLKQSGLFDKVILGGEVGESDILAYQNDEKLFIYSLKNLKVDRDPYWLIVNPKKDESESELKPEIEFAKLSHFDYEIHLVLLVYDNYNDKIIQKEIDYKHPQNINLAKGVSI